MSVGLGSDAESESEEDGLRVVAVECESSSDSELEVESQEDSGGMLRDGISRISLSVSGFLLVSAFKEERCRSPASNSVEADS